MLRLCKDGEFFDLVLGGRRIASVRFEGVYPEWFSRDAGEIAGQLGKVQVRIVPEEEYEYLLDCEEMLASLSKLIGEKVENT